MSTNDITKYSLLISRLKHNYKLWLPAVLAGLIWTAQLVFMPLLVEGAVDKGIIPTKISAILFFSIAIAIVGIIQGSMSAIRRYFAFKNAYSIETQLRSSLFAHVQELHLAFHDRYQTGQIMSRAVTDLQQITNFLVNLPITLSSIFVVLATAIILIMINPILALIVLISIPSSFVYGQIFNKRQQTVTLEMQNSLGAISTLTEQSITGIKTVKGFGYERVFIDNVSESTNRFFTVAKRLILARSSFNAVQQVLPYIGQAGVLFYGGFLVLSHRLPLGSLVATLVYANMLLMPLGLISFTLSLLPRALSSSERIAEILAISPEIKDPPKPVSLGKQFKKFNSLSVEFRDVTFTYPSRTSPILKNFSLKIEEGQTLALVGPTASGKSTVVKLLERFYDVDAGEVLVGGINVKNFSLSDLRSLIGIVFEDSYLFSGTVRENIALGRPTADLEEIIRAAKHAGAHEFILGLADGYDSILGPDGQDLSGGQRQRIALARALITDPKILILDDATSSVDAEKESQIVDSLEEVMKDRTTLLIAHRASTIKKADVVAFIDSSRVIGCAKHEELLEKLPNYRQYFENVEKKSGKVIEVFE